MFLHSIVPHEHHGELSEQEEVVLHSSNECFCDWLQLVFHDDLGTGHLENFVQGEEPNFVKVSKTIPVVAAISFDTNFLQSETDVTPIVKQSPNEFYRSLYSRHPDALRGPPMSA